MAAVTSAAAAADDKTVSSTEVYSTSSEQARLEMSDVVVAN